MPPNENRRPPRGAAIRESGLAASAIVAEISPRRPAVAIVRDFCVCYSYGYSDGLVGVQQTPCRCADGPDTWSFRIGWRRGYEAAMANGLR
jgi:hypothetical protein